MGEVWLAEDTRLKRRIAVKLLPLAQLGDQVALENLRRETARGQALTHPNVIRVHDLQEAGDLALLTMEYVEGMSLAELRLKQPGQVFSWSWLAPVIAQLCEVLSYAHGEKLIHRDLKPSNIMLDTRGRLKLADFGISATLSETLNHASCQLPRAGTLAYMSPQQLAGLLPRPSDDIHALGAMLYALISGQPPFATGDLSHQIRHIEAAPISVRLKELQINNPIPPHVEAVIARCLAKRAEDRPQTITEVASLLKLGPALTVDAPQPNRDASGVLRDGLPTEPRSKLGRWAQQAFAPLFQLSHHRQRLAAAVGAGCLAAFCGVLLLHPQIGSSIANWSFDLLTLSLPRVSPSEVVITYLDDKSHKALGQPGDAHWDRNYHAQLIERLHEQGAKAIVFDILFDTTNSASALADAALERAITRGNVVLCNLPSSVHQSGQGQVDSIIHPLERFRRVAKGSGSAQLFADADLTIRQHPPTDTDHVPLSMAALIAIGGRVADSDPTARWMRYYGPPGAIPHVSFHKALQPDGTAPGYFKDKVVFVGAGEEAGFSSSKKDSYRNPFSQLAPAFSSGVEVHATAFLNLARGDWLRRLSQPVETWSVLGLGLLAGYFLVMLRPLAGLCVAGGATLAVAGLALVAAREAHTWFAWAVVCLEIGLAYLVSLIFNTLRSRREIRLLERALAVHLPARRVKEILKRPERLKPGTEKREVSLLFSQIADFPSLADRTTPEKLYPRLNTYFSDLIACVHDNDGTIIKLTGDGVFALWNAPEEQTRHQELACRAALAIHQRLQGVKGGRIDFPFRTRVGIHFGAVAVGNFGSEERMDYMAAGSSVNLASALAQLNKHLGTSILASDAVVEAAGDAIAVRALGWFRMPGFQQQVPVFEVLGLSTDPLPREWVTEFEQALERFRERDFAEAARLFERVLALRPGDVATGLYLKRISEFQHQPPPSDWFGELAVPAA